MKEKKKSTSFPDGNKPGEIPRADKKKRRKKKSCFDHLRPGDANIFLKGKSKTSEEMDPDSGRFNTLIEVDFTSKAKKVA